MRTPLPLLPLLMVAAHAPTRAADSLPPTADPAEQAIMPEVASALAGRSLDLARLDAVLAKLPRPKLVASFIFTFAGSPQRAADLWMEASREAPALAATSHRYLLMALIGRLKDVGDQARADRLGARLGEIGFSSALAPERSQTALARTRQAVREDRVGDARLDVTAMGDPDDLLTLYVDRRYAALWPQIAEWAGADLAAQSRRYLEELRGEWAAADDFTTATPYARRLNKLEAYTAVVDLFLPMFERPRADGQQDDREVLAPPVANSLARLGREAEAQALLARVAAAMPADDGGNGLNIDAAQLRLTADRVDWPQVVRHADAFLARARVLGPNINRSAVIEVEAWRACALWRSDHAAEAAPAEADVLFAEAVLPKAAMILHTCKGDAKAAQALVLARLGDDATRDWALRFVQPTARDARTPLEHLMQPVEQAVRSAPDVVQAVSRLGRILPGPVDAALPDGFDPFRLRTRRPIGPDSV